jgi:hypothetical protein
MIKIRSASIYREFNADSPRRPARACYVLPVLSRHRFFAPSRRSIALLGLVGLATLAPGCREPATTLTGLDDARSLVADLRVQFNKGADASNRAVMADTDEASLAFAKESEKAMRAVSNDVAALAPLLDTLSLSRELPLFAEFKTQLSRYQELDHRILGLAVENTNLKAQSLSFGPARQAADAFRDSLAQLATSFPPKGRCQVAGLVAQAVTAVREIQVLHAPHIAERDDAPMANMEKEMAALDATARGALKTLDDLAPLSAQPALATARTELDKFKGLSAQIVLLSRRNTNVLSLDLSLRQKPALASACDERLSALQTELAHEGSKATR